MEIHFEDNKKGKQLKKECESNKEAKKTYGTNVAKHLITALYDLIDSPTLGDMDCRNPHPLDGDLKGCFAISITGKYRIIFKPNDNPPSLKDDGSIDRDGVISILIVDICNYH